MLDSKEVLCNNNRRVQKNVEILGVRDWKKGFESEKGKVPKEYVNKEGVLD